MSPRRLFLSCAALLALAPAVHAQVQVRLTIARRLFMCYEPIIASVSITNLTGRDLTLSDAPPEKWFGFDILNSEDSPIPPRAPDYHLQPMTIPAGQTIKRNVNLVNLYPVTDFGTYRVRAAIYVAPLNRYVSSAEVPIEVTEGKTVWQQTIGVPDGQHGAGESRNYELLAFRQTNANYLYVRVEDRAKGTVFGTYPIGRLINGYDPQIEIDPQNQLNVLQMVEPKSYYYTRVGPNAELLGQQAYIETTTRPHLKKGQDGDVNVVGGHLIEEKTAGAARAAAGPKISDRPAGMPAQ